MCLLSETGVRVSAISYLEIGAENVYQSTDSYFTYDGQTALADRVSISLIFMNNHTHFVNSVNSGTALASYIADRTR